MPGVIATLMDIYGNYLEFGEPGAGYKRIISDWADLNCSDVMTKKDSERCIMALKYVKRENAPLVISGNVEHGGKSGRRIFHINPHNSPDRVVVYTTMPTILNNTHTHTHGKNQAITSIK